MQRKQMRLGKLARDLSLANEPEDAKGIDFGAAGLYVPAAQTVFAVTLSSTVSVISCWLVPVTAISAIRTLAFTATSGALVVHRPIRLGATKGINMIFSALRPCCFLYVGTLVLEQLVHTCVGGNTELSSIYYVRILHNGCSAVLVLAAFLQSRQPRGDSDLPFVLACVALLAVALLPPPAIAFSGPLCAPPTLFGAFERLIRAFAFASVYVTTVYAGAPISNTLADTFICVARATTASVWVLGAVIYMLPLACLQIVLVLYTSFSSSQLEYASVVRQEEAETAAHSAHTHGCSAASTPLPTVAEAMTRRPRSPDIEMSIGGVTAAAAQDAARPVCFQPINGNNLSFNLKAVNGGAVLACTEERMAEIAAHMP